MSALQCFLKPLLTRSSMCFLYFSELSWMACSLQCLYMYSFKVLSHGSCKIPNDDRKAQKVDGLIENIAMAIKDVYF